MFKSELYPPKNTRQVHGPAQHNPSISLARWRTRQRFLRARVPPRHGGNFSESTMFIGLQPLIESGRTSLKAAEFEYSAFLAVAYADSPTKDEECAAYKYSKYMKFVQGRKKETYGALAMRYGVLIGVHV